MTPEDPVTQALRLAGDGLATTGAWLIGELLLEVSGCHWLSHRTIQCYTKILLTIALVSKTLPWLPVVCVKDADMSALAKYVLSRKTSDLISFNAVTFQEWFTGWHTDKNDEKKKPGTVWRNPLFRCHTAFANHCVSNHLFIVTTIFASFMADLVL